MHCATFGETKNTTYEHKLLIPTVKPDGGGVMIWARFAIAGLNTLHLLSPP